MGEPLPIYTIGHSTRSIEQFADLLRCGEVELLIDVRTVQKSRRNRCYNEELLGRNLRPYGISYERLADLGGLRSRLRDVPPFVIYLIAAGTRRVPSHGRQSSRPPSSHAAPALMVTGTFILYLRLPLHRRVRRKQQMRPLDRGMKFAANRD